MSELGWAEIVMDLILFSVFSQLAALFRMIIVNIVNPIHFSSSPFSVDLDVSDSSSPLIYPLT